MDIREILALRRPTLLPASWLPDTLAWLPRPHRLYRDERGEIMAIAHAVGKPDAGTLFACHLDTLHYRPGRQTLREAGGQSRIVRAGNGECLGADAGAGAWLMLELIEAGVPGTYLFHLARESGCRGSRWMETQHADWLRGFSCCLGLDRHGATDVITHFAGIRSCTPAFAERLSRMLSRGLEGHSLSPREEGSLTDVIRYIGIIPECTSISVGYHQPLSTSEWLDVGYLYALKRAMIGALSAGPPLAD